MKLLNYILALLLFQACLLITSCCFGQNSLHQDTLYRFGVASYLTAGKLDSAILSAQQLNGNNPDNEKNSLLGILYEKKGDTASSNAYFNKALNDPTTDKSKVHSTLAMIAFHRNDIAGAKQQLLLAIKQDSTKPKRFFLLGKFYSYLNNPDSALVNFQKAYSLDPTNASYAQTLHASYYNKGMVREAMPFLNKWATADSLSVGAQLALIAQRIELDSFSAALPLLRRIVRLAPMNDTIFFNLGVCQLETGDTLEALKNLRQSILIAQIPVQAVYDRLAAAYEAKGRIYEMLSVVRQGAKNGFLPYSSWMARYQPSLSDARHLDSAFQHDKPADQLKDLISFASLSAFQRNDRKTLNFLRLYESMHGIPTDTVFILKARAEMGLGRFQEAKADIQTAIRMAPSNLAYQALLAAILYRIKDYKDLITVLLPLDPVKLVAPTISAEDRAALLFKAYTVQGDTADALPYFAGN